MINYLKCCRKMRYTCMGFLQITNYFIYHDEILIGWYKESGKTFGNSLSWKCLVPTINKWLLINYINKWLLNQALRCFILFICSYCIWQKQGKVGKTKMNNYWSYWYGFSIPSINNAAQLFPTDKKHNHILGLKLFAPVKKRVI